MIFRAGINAIYAVAHLNRIQVSFHDALLAPYMFYKECEVNLKSLSQPAASRPQKYIFCRLLADGACTVQFLALVRIVLSRLLNSIKIKALMKKKTLVFTRHDGNRHIWRDMVQ